MVISVRIVAKAIKSFDILPLRLSSKEPLGCLAHSRGFFNE